MKKSSIFFVLMLCLFFSSALNVRAATFDSWVSDVTYSASALPAQAFDNDDTTYGSFTMNSVQNAITFSKPYNLTGFKVKSEGFKFYIEFYNSNNSLLGYFENTTGTKEFTFNYTNVSFCKLYTAGSTIQLYELEFYAIDNTPPSLVSSLPVNNSTGIETTRDIILTYDKPIQSIDSVIFGVCLGPTVIGGSYTPSYTILNNVVKIPVSNLKYNTDYALYINGVKGTNGYKTTPFYLYFKTENDTVPPVVKNIIPPPGSTNVDTNTTVQIQFSKNIDSNSLSKVYIEGVEASKSVNGDTVTLTLNSALEYDKQYSIHIEGVKDTLGNTMATPVIVGFTTKKDDSPLKLLGYKPSGIYPKDTGFEYTFNKNLDKSSLDMTVQNSKGESVDFVTEVIGTKLTVYPSMVSGDYVITLNSIKDTSGNLYSEPVSLQVTALGSSGSTDLDTVTGISLNALNWLKQNGFELFKTCITVLGMIAFCYYLWRLFRIWLKYIS